MAHLALLTSSGVSSQAVGLSFSLPDLVIAVVLLAVANSARPTQKKHRVLVAKLKLNPAQFTFICKSNNNTTTTTASLFLGPI